jgi:hypothetical protein
MLLSSSMMHQLSGNGEQAAHAQLFMTRESKNEARGMPYEIEGNLKRTRSLRKLLSLYEQRQSCLKTL